LLATFDLFKLFVGHFYTVSCSYNTPAAKRCLKDHAIKFMDTKSSKQKTFSIRKCKIQLILLASFSFKNVIKILKISPAFTMYYLSQQFGLPVRKAKEQELAFALTSFKAKRMTCDNLSSA
jgi:hypothetical protein